MIPMNNLRTHKFKPQSGALNSARPALLVVALMSSACMANLGFAPTNQGSHTADFALELLDQSVNTTNHDFANADSAHASTSSADQSSLLSFVPNEKLHGADSSSNTGNGHSNRGNHHHVTSLIINGTDFLQDSRSGSFTMGKVSPQAVPLPGAAYAGLGLLAGMIGIRSIRSRRSNA